MGNICSSSASSNQDVAEGAESKRGAIVLNPLSETENAAEIDLPSPGTPEEDDIANDDGQSFRESEVENRYSSFSSSIRESRAGEDRGRSTSVTEYRRPVSGRLYRKSDRAEDQWTVQWFCLETNKLFYFDSSSQHELKRAPNGFFHLSEAVVLDENVAAPKSSSRKQNKKLTKQQSMVQRRLYEAIDIDGDGELTKAEVVAAHEQLGVTREAAAELFDIMDVNSDGSISREEFVQAHRGQFCFSLGYGRDAPVVLATDTAVERARWCESLLAAVNGAWFAHEEAQKDDGRTTSQGQESFSATDLLRLPQLTGTLKKQATGRKKLGISSGEKTRYFKLLGSTLRYYSDKTMKPSSLKGSIALEGCEVLPAPTDQDIHLKLPDGLTLRCRASTPEIALEWNGSLRTTTRLLQATSHEIVTRRHLITIHEDSSGGLRKPSRSSSARAAIDAKTRRVLASALASSYAFKDALDHLDKIVDVMKLEESRFGDCVCHEGELGNHCYVLVDGAAEVIRRGDITAELSAGVVFGEVSLIHASATRNATVRMATSRCVLFSLHRNDFREQLSGGRKIQYEENIAFLRCAPLLKALPSPSLSRVADILRTKSFTVGTYIMREDEIGDTFYLIKEGEVVVTQTRDFEREIARYTKGHYFGELALLQPNGRRAANVKVVSKVCVCYTVDRETFESHLGQGCLKEAVEADVIVSAVKASKFSKYFSQVQLDFAARHPTSRTYQDGSRIIREGDAQVDDIFVVAAGEVIVQKRGKPILEVLSSGSCFGGGAFTGEKQALASMVAKGAVVIRAISRPVAGMDDDTSDRETLSFRDTFGFLRGRANSSAASAAAAPSMSIHLDDLDTLSTIGTGQLGGVRLVSHNGQLLALRVLYKARLQSKGLAKRTFDARDILREISPSPFVVRLFATLSDSDNLYTLLECCHGDLFDLLHSNSRQLPAGPLGGCTVHHAKFYAANVLTILRVLQDHSVVHRALIPENLLIDRSGYLKLASFDVAKKLHAGQRTGTLCGIPEYLAPEVIAVKAYGTAVDLWALGCLIFELLTNHSPFYDPDEQEMTSRIVHAESSLNTALEHKSMDKDTESILRQLLSQDESERLGAGGGGLADIWKHRWFAKTNKAGIEARAVTAPFLPHLKSPEELEATAVVDTGSLDTDTEPYSGPRRLFAEWEQCYFD